MYRLGTVARGPTFAMARTVTVAATQMAISRDLEANLVITGCLAGWVSCIAYCVFTTALNACVCHAPQANAEEMVRKAAAAGAQIILLQVKGPQRFDDCERRMFACVGGAVNDAIAPSCSTPLQELFENVYFGQEQKAVSAPRLPPLLLSIAVRRHLRPWRFVQRRLR